MPKLVDARLSVVKIYSLELLTKELGPEISQRKKDEPLTFQDKEKVSTIEVGKRPLHMYLVTVLCTTVLGREYQQHDDDLGCVTKNSYLLL